MKQHKLPIIIITLLFFGLSVYAQTQITIPPKETMTFSCTNYFSLSSGPSLPDQNYQSLTLDCTCTGDEETPPGADVYLQCNERVKASCHGNLDTIPLLGNRTLSLQCTTPDLTFLPIILK